MITKSEHLAWVHNFGVFHELGMLQLYAKMMERFMVTRMESREELENEFALAFEYHKLFSQALPWLDSTAEAEGVFRHTQEKFIQELRYSLLVALHSIVENDLVDACKVLREHHHFPLKIGDLKGQGIEQAKIYLQKVARIEMHQSNWEAIELYRELRNLIVHARGSVDDAHRWAKRVRNPTLRAKYFYEFNESDDLILSGDFVNEAVVQTLYFFGRLLGTWRKWTTSQLVQDNSQT